MKCDLVLPKGDGELQILGRHGHPRRERRTSEVVDACGPQRVAFVGQAPPRGENTAFFAGRDVGASVPRREVLEELEELAFPRLYVAQPNLLSPRRLVLRGHSGALDLLDVTEELRPSSVKLFQILFERSGPAKPLGNVAIVERRFDDI